MTLITSYDFNFNMIQTTNPNLGFLAQTIDPNLTLIVTIINSLFNCIC